MGKLYLKTLDLPNARAHFEKAIALDPLCAEAGISLATTMLMQGDLANGWKYYRNRFKYSSSRRQAYPFHYHLPLWHGETFTHKRLIVHAEQGFGDTIQFARFLPAVKARGLLMVALKEIGHHLPVVFYLVFGFLVSLICGFQFPVALYLRGGDAPAVTQTFSADLIGAAFGTLITNVVLIPYFGIIWTAAGLIGLKFLSLTVTFLSYENV